ncbi:MAG TPA: hemolysin family protein, partial [Chloroflexota bacterium]|nr:hemolysin family protein [Chloroflexota bacterium]
RTARQTMTPRTRVQGLPLGATLEEAVRGALDARHSRLPVYEGDLDHIVGVVHLRDLFTALAARSNAPFSLRRLLRPAPAVPDGLMLDEALALLRGSRTQLAVVVDEYGGTAGILTIGDILEEIVGEVRDEFDPPEPAEFAIQPDGSWLLDGLLALDEVDEQVGTRLADATDSEGESVDVDTLGGLVMARLGRLAEVGDLVLEPGDPPVWLRVEEVAGRRIVRVALRKETTEAAPRGHPA